MKNLYLIIYVALLYGCGIKTTVKTDHYVKNQDRLDSLYESHSDIERKTIIKHYKHKSDTSVIVRRIPKKRTIFKRGKVYIYDVAYIDVSGDTLSYNKIELIPLGRRDPMPLNQDDIVFNNAYSTKDSLKFPTCPLNKSFKIMWEKQRMEGVIENVEHVWMHPLRCNHYFFTETAPFPSVHLPIYAGQNWKIPFEISDGGDWSNKKGMHYYKVVKKEKRVYDKLLLDCWQIKSKAKFEFGTSYLTYYFNEQNGFVEMNYINYIGQKLNIVLKEVTSINNFSDIFWDNLKGFWIHDVLTD